MGQKRVSSKDAPEAQALHESFTPIAGTAAKGSVRPDIFSTNARQRRAKLIAQINASWSEKSERALSVIAEQYRINDRSS